MLRSEGIESLFDALVNRIGRPRRWRQCPTCLDFGMLEDERGNEDTCPTCEGGIWRERESWRWYIHRQAWLGFRVLFFRRRPSWLPEIHRERSV